MTFSVLTAWGSSNNKVLPGRQSPFINTFVNSLTFVQADWLSVKNTQKSQRLISVFCCWLLWCLGSTRLSHSHFYGRKTSQANSRSTIHTHRQADLWKSVSRILAIFCQNILMKVIVSKIYVWLASGCAISQVVYLLFTYPAWSYAHILIYYIISIAQRIKSLCLGCWALCIFLIMHADDQALYV